MTSKITVELPTGKKYDFIHAYGVTYNAMATKMLPNKDLKQQIDQVKELEIRDDDTYLATYPKCGTHWVWEILVMLKRGNAVYETKTKEAAFLDFRSRDEADAIPSPRILNCHYPCKLSPKGIFEKGIKIVHVMRNPKDAFVSFYHHHLHFNDQPSKPSFEEYLPQLLGENGIYQFYPWFKYVKEWERFTKQHPDQILNLYYEDLKEDPIREIKKINSFLGTERSEELMEQIAKACDFENLKKADAEVKVQIENMRDDKRPSIMYRKGQVGDWKNHFTVYQNEKFDQWLEENLVDTDLKFRYTL